jgi:putative ABC transport system permease protein
VTLSVSASVTFDRVIEGFMGLGLTVGVAALSVVSAGSVVERR